MRCILHKKPQVRYMKKALHYMTLKGKKREENPVYFFLEKKAHPGWNLFAYRLPIVICSQSLPKKVLRQLNEFKKSMYVNCISEPELQSQ